MPFFSEYGIQNTEPGMVWNMEYGIRELSATLSFIDVDRQDMQIKWHAGYEISCHIT